MTTTRRAVQQWGSDGLFFTEAARGGPYAWRAGEDKLEGDALGPVRHAHDEAAEYYYMFSGSAHVETGGEEFVLKEGELGLIPPDAPHNFLGPATDQDACLFCLVSPNLADNKWRVRDFLPRSESLRMTVAKPFVDEQLPGDGRLTAHALALDPGKDPIALTPDGFEVVYIVVDGAADLAIENHLSGTISAGTYVHLREGMSHTLAARSDSRVLRLDARFDAWHGVPGAADAA